MVHQRASTVTKYLFLLFDYAFGYLSTLQYIGEHRFIYQRLSALITRLFVFEFTESPADGAFQLEVSRTPER